MAERIRIDFERIEAHARRVDKVSSDVGLASDAAGTMNIGGGAFGVLCSFLVPPGLLATQMANSAISAAGEMLSRSATELRATGADFELLENDLVEAIRSIEGVLK